MGLSDNTHRERENRDCINWGLTYKSILMSQLFVILFRWKQLRGSIIFLFSPLCLCVILWQKCIPVILLCQNSIGPVSQNHQTRVVFRNRAENNFKKTLCCICCMWYGVNGYVVFHISKTHLCCSLSSFQNSHTNVERYQIPLYII